MGTFCLKNHGLELFPGELFFSKSHHFSFLCLSVLELKHADEEVKEEKGANQDKDDEENGLLYVALVAGSVVNSRYIDGLMHDIRPAFQ